MLVLLGSLLGVASAHFIAWKEPGTHLTTSAGTPLRPGPWGELYSVPFTISPPEELLPIRLIEESGTHWLFKNFALSELSHFLDSLDLSEGLRNMLLDPAVTQVSPVGVELTPNPDTVLAIPAAARQAIYRQLAQFPENRSAFTFIHKSTVSYRFEESGVSHATLELFHALCCEHGDYLVFGGLPALLSQLPSYEEKVRFVKALTRQRTIIVRLHIAKDTDVASLSAYWGRGAWAANTRSKLEAVQDIPGGTVMNIMALLPPGPASRLNDYPTLPSAPSNHPVPVHDCHWTSLNFFRDTADEEAVDGAGFARKISEDYFPVINDPRYGDILVFSRPDGEIVHSAVFIADDIAFTKNGATSIFPWMLSTIPDLQKQYSFLAPEGQQLTLHYFRSKEM
jgi:hypothetical protein